MVAWAFGLAGCDLGYGASFGYPSEPPVPPGASIIAKAEGWDDDDPMRGREVVIDTAKAGPAELVGFYREQFPPSEGWLDGQPDADVGGGHLLCLVNQSDDGYDVYVEIYPYWGDFESAGPHRYLMSVSRLYVPEGRERKVNRCGLAGIWYPRNL